MLTTRCLVLLPLFFIIKVLSIKIRVCIYLAFIFPLFVNAQGLFTKTISIEDGLISYDNYKIIKDHNGAIWVSSDKGVTKFYGNSYKQFTNQNGLSTNDIWNLRLDSKNRIWLYHYANGVQYIENDSVKNIKGSEKWNNIFYSGAKGDTLFFRISTDKKETAQYSYLNGKLEYYSPFKNINLEIKADFSDKGILLLTDSKKEKINYIYSINSKKITQLNSGIFSFGYFGINNDDNIFKEDGHNIPLIIKNERFTPPNIPEFNDISAQDRIHCSQEFILIKKKDVIIIIDSKTFNRRKDIEEIIHANQLSSINIRDLCLDNQGNVWILEERGKLFFIHNNALWAKQIAFLNNFDKNHIFQNTIKIPNSDLILIRNNYNEIHTLNTKTNKIKWIWRYDSPALRDIKIRDNKIFLLGTYNFKLSIYEFKIHNNELILTKKIAEKSMPSDAYCMDFINDSTLILGNGRIITFDNKGHISAKNLLDKSPSRSMNLIYNDSVLYFISKTEAKSIDLKNFRHKILPIENPTCLLSHKEKLFFGTDGKGIHILTNNHLQKFDFEYTVNNIIPYNNDYFLCTNKGLLLCSFVENNIIVKKSYFSQKHFSIDVNNVIIKKDTLFTFTNRGIIQIFENLKQNDSWGLGKYSITIISASKERNKNIFEQGNPINFLISNESYFDISQYFYRYKIEGSHKGWIYTQKGNIQINNLDVGNHTLLIESSYNLYGEYNNPKKISFYIDQPFHKKLNFILLIIIAIIIISTIFLFIARNISFKKKTIKFRMKELELKALTAQLNPHFVFNSMNNIQAMIFANSKEQVNDYICSFSELIRYVLDSSRTEKISLKEEIKFLNNYLSLETFRLNGTLNYKIECHPSISTENKYIYGMVIQPFVENSIIHGFKTNQEIKNITIDIQSIDENHITITIEDNGIGRNKSQLLKKGNEHKSWASTILHEKSELLNSIRKDSLTVNIFDKQDDGGTIVVVTIKVNQ